MRSDPSLGIERGCRLLHWDSEFFGRRIAQVEPRYLDRAGWSAVAEWCADRRIDCLYLLADVDDQPVCRIAQAHGFMLVDVRVTLESVAPPATAMPRVDGPIVRTASAADVEALKAIARESHRDTRFYTDGHFERRRCDELYELWIVKSCRGWADRVWVAQLDGVAAGYLTCQLQDGAARIGLVAVAAASRGRGAGSALIDTARRWCAGEGAHRLSVVTQARNAAALRLYQQAGLSVRSIQLWFHRWF